MTRVKRIPLRSWMFIYIGLVAAFALTGRPADIVQQEAALPVPAIIGNAPLLRKDI